MVQPARHSYRSNKMRRCCCRSPLTMAVTGVAALQMYLLGTLVLDPRLQGGEQQQQQPVAAVEMDHPQHISARTERKDQQRNPFAPNIANGFKIQASDIVMKRDYDASPIVVPQFRLVFFTTPKVACTTWKQLFRRMAGHKDWQDAGVAHDPTKNGLTYLSDYSVVEIQNILQDSNWTKALWVRDPKERFLSAYLDKAVSNDAKHLRPCCRQYLQEHTDNNNSYGWTQVSECLAFAQGGLANFLQFVQTVCPDDPHWRPQSQRMEAQYWKLLEDQLVVGHFESNALHARQLLEDIGAWNPFGNSLWGPPASSAAAIFGGVVHQGHVTGSQSKMSWYYTPELEEKVDEYYRADYELKVLGLTPKPVVYPPPKK